MVSVDEALTRRVAELARLELTVEEVAAYSGQLREILAYVEQLREVDVSGVEPLAHPLDQVAPWREDGVVESPRAADGRPAVLASAPEVEDGGFKVPQVV